MKVTVNRNFFLRYALLMISCNSITIIAHEGILSVASLGNTGNFRIPAYTADPGQAYLSNQKWKILIHKVLISSNRMIDIIL